MKTAYIFQPQIKIICMEIEGNTIQNSVIMPITLQCTNLNFTHLFRNSKMTVTQIEIFLKFHNIRLLHTALLCLKTFFFFPKKCTQRTLNKERVVYMREGSDAVFSRFLGLSLESRELSELSSDSEVSPYSGPWKLLIFLRVIFALSTAKFAEAIFSGVLAFSKRRTKKRKFN